MYQALSESKDRPAADSPGIDAEGGRMSLLAIGSAEELRRSWNRRYLVNEKVQDDGVTAKSLRGEKQLGPVRYVPAKQMTARRSPSKGQLLIRVMQGCQRRGREAQAGTAADFSG